MWWSFYESDSGFNDFVARALCYVSGQAEDLVARLPRQEQEARLLRHLTEAPYLLVLDGLERMLVAYDRIDKNADDDSYRPKIGTVALDLPDVPTNATESFASPHRLRQTIVPRAGAFLQKLTQITKSRILITTRLFPDALQTPNGNPRPGCTAYFIQGLSDDEALALWRALGVTVSPLEFIPIAHATEGHPLVLQAFAGEVANYRKAPGDFSQWRADHPELDPTALPLVQSRTHILDFALQRLSIEVRQVLNLLVGLRAQVSFATLEAVLVGQDKACQSTHELDRALTELEDRGLIRWDRQANSYGVHPIVRSIVWNRLSPNDQQSIFNALAAYL